MTSDRNTERPDMTIVRVFDAAAASCAVVGAEAPHLHDMTPIDATPRK
jgi:hypothetical protein